MSCGSDGRAAGGPPPPEWGGGHPAGFGGYDARYPPHQPPAPVPPPAAAMVQGLPPAPVPGGAAPSAQQRDLIRQVLAMPMEEINRLPPKQREQILAIRKVGQELMRA